MKLAKRWLKIIAGVIITITGIILMPVPGPGGTPVTLAGLAILATEFSWAKRLMEKMKAFLNSHHLMRSNKWVKAGVVTAAISFYAISSFVAFRMFAG